MSLNEFGGRRTPRRADARVSAWADDAADALERGHDHAPMSAEARRQAWDRQGIGMVLLCIASLIAVEALLFAPGHVLAGQIADAVLLFLILQVRLGPVRRPPTSWSSSHAPSLGWNPSVPAREAMRSLALIPLIRVVSIGLPLRDVSHAAGTLAVALIVGSGSPYPCADGRRCARAFLTARLPRVQLRRSSEGCCSASWPIC